MDRETAKEELKGRLAEYVERITEPDRRAGRGMYKCPLCGSGTGSSRNSNGAFSITKDGEGWKCFSCNEGGDLFNLIGKVEGLSEFNDQLARAAELFNITIDTEYTQKAKRTRKEGAQRVKRETPKQPAADFTNYIEACKAAVGKTDYFKSRGFTAETIERYSLGYDESKGVIVIPYSKNGNYYITRSVSGKSFRKPPADIAGEEPIYNKAALYSGQPCFICEAPIDAISIMQAGGSAVALGGTGSYKLVEALKVKKPAAMLILNFDNDEAGEKAAATLAADLKGLEIPFIKAAYSFDDYPENKKDANDLLRGNGALFSKEVAENVSRAQRIANAEIEEKRAAYSTVSGAGRLKDFLDGIKDSANTPYTSTGFKGLDNELDGGLYAGLYILGAVSSLGKTTLALQIADNIAKSGQDVLIFSLEMAASELIAKSLSRLTYELAEDKNGDGESKTAKTNRGITTRSRYEHYSPEEKELIKKAIASYAEYSKHIFIIEGLGDIGAEQVKRAVEEHKKITGNTPIILIDYLQILAPYEVRASDKQNTDKAVLELKRLSRDYQTPVIGISSFNRDNYTSAVSMAAFKESGAIEYGSDVLIALQPAGMKEAISDKDKAANKKTLDDCKASARREVEAVILKNRNGKTGGKVTLKYSAMFNYFEEDDHGLAQWRASRAAGDYNPYK